MKEIIKDVGHTKPSLGMELYAEAIPHLGCKSEEVEFPLPPSFLRETRSA